MKSLHAQLASYTKKCDEILLSKNLKKLIDEANKKIPQLTPKKLNKIKKEVVVIDVREPEEFASGFIEAKAVLTIPRGKLEFMAIEKIAKEFGQDAKIVTYCLKGARGSLAALHLKKLGFSDVSNLEGGILAWIQAGYTIKNYLGEFKAL
ncbi:hypothetical protein MNB_SM-7-527 [hydrothermal vent metagenome]|uniref:Rhodanese domain-containing protein n=1 Tax=hydrothermal vent metagenome TaxID=652676 RepID=A0A1W1C1Q9_9ZZZZ